MKKVIIFVLLISISFLCFTTSVSAETKTCYYNSRDKSGGYYEYAELTINNPSNSNAKATFENLQGPKIDCNIGADIGAVIGGGAGGALGLVCGPAVVICAPAFSAAGNLIAKAITGGNYCAFKTNDLKTNQTKDYSSAASKYLNTNLKYVDAQGKNQTVSLPNIDLGSECPEYLGVVISDAKADSANVQIYAGDSSTKSFIDSYVRSNPDYNYVIWGSEFERTGEPGTGQNGASNSQNDEDLNTCNGLLGNKVDGKYQNGTVGALLQQIFDYMKMAVVILVFAFSVIDYAKAIAAQNQDAFKKANVNFLKRIIFGIIFFLIPTIINLILSVIDSSTCGIQ